MCVCRNAKQWSKLSDFTTEHIVLILQLSLQCLANEQMVHFSLTINVWLVNMTLPKLGVMSMNNQRLHIIECSKFQCSVGGARLVNPTLSGDKKRS